MYAVNVEDKITKVRATVMIGCREPIDALRLYGLFECASFAASEVFEVSASRAEKISANRLSHETELVNRVMFEAAPFITARLSKEND